MGYDYLIAIGPVLISSITSIIIVALICVKLDSFSLVVRARRRRKKRYPVRPPGGTDYWSDQRQEVVD